MRGWTLEGPSAFEPERAGPLREDRRHLPAAIRVFGQLTAPAIEEGPCFSAVRYLTDSRMRRQIAHKRPTKQYGVNTRKLMMWLFLHDDATRWWQSWWGWRSPREFAGWRGAELAIKAPHVEPWELAQLRLPDDVSMDLDVVVLQAWCQGVVARFLADLELDYNGAILDCLKTGLRKLHASPWFQLVLAAEHMQPVGMLFPGRSFSTSCLRMDAILRDPYSATDGELEILLASYPFKVAYAKAAAWRRAKTPRFLRPGPWYADGNHLALGPNFHRGGTPMAREEVEYGEEAQG